MDGFKPHRKRQENLELVQNEDWFQHKVPRIKNEDHLIGLIGGYVANCRENNKPITMSGLAFAIGMARKNLLEYKKQDKYGDIITRFRQMVEVDLEEKLYNKDFSTQGVTFSLKNNFDWKEKSEQDIKSDVTINLPNGVEKYCE